MTYRASYWKTTAISFMAACLCLFSLVRLFSLRLAFVPLSLVGFALAMIALTCLLIATGGLVCLWRDTREIAGIADFLACSAVRIPTPSLLSALGLRFLQGARLRPGDLVQVRPRHEIEATLDAKRAMAGLPFMFEMEAFCNRVFRVHRRVDHINDMRNKTGLRRIHNVVTLTDVRCSGCAHGGCQAECQILWNDAWLRKIPDRQRPIAVREAASYVPLPSRSGDSQEPDPTYSCQMTALWEVSQSLAPIDIRQDFRPLISGNVSPADFLLALFTRMFNVVQDLRGGAGYPYMPQHRIQSPTPSAEHHFKAGDAVVVRSKDEISHTLLNGKNKGLWFDKDMIRFCGRPAIVRKRVSRIIHESTGKMVVLKTPCIVLEDVVATGEFLRLCPQHEYIFWREIWLRPSSQVQQSEIAPGR